MFRKTVAFVSMIVGLLVAALDLAIALPALPPQQRGLAGRGSPEEQRLIFDACVTTFGIAYTVARWLYLWFGAEAEATELRNWSRWHLGLLKLLGGVWLLTSGVKALQEALFRPALLVGAYLLVWAVVALWQGIRSWREPPSASPAQELRYVPEQQPRRSARP